MLFLRIHWPCSAEFQHSGNHHHHSSRAPKSISLSLSCISPHKWTMTRHFSIFMHGQRSPAGTSESFLLVRPHRFVPIIRPEIDAQVFMSSMLMGSKLCPSSSSSRTCIARRLFSNSYQSSYVLFLGQFGSDLY